MKELAIAILARYTSSNGNALRAVTPGGMWRDQAPRRSDDKNYPLITFNFPADAVEPLLESKNHDIQNVTFSIYGTNEPPVDSLDVAHDPTDQIDTIYDLLIALYDDVILTLANSKNVVYAQRIGKNIVPDPDSGKVCHVQYNYRVG